MTMTCASRTSESSTARHRVSPRTASPGLSVTCLSQRSTARHSVWLPVWLPERGGRVTASPYNSPLSALREHVEDLVVALAIWEARTEPDAHARRCAGDAVDTWGLAWTPKSPKTSSGLLRRIEVDSCGPGNSPEKRKPRSRRAAGPSCSAPPRPGHPGPTARSDSLRIAPTVSGCRGLNGWLN